MNRFEQFGEHPAFESEQSDNIESEVSSPEKLIQKSSEAFIELEDDFNSIEDTLASAPDSSRLQEIKQQAEKVLKVAARKILKWSRNAALTGLLAVTYAAVDLHEQGHYKDRERAQQEMVTDGITHEQRVSAYKPGLSEIVYRGIEPFGYQEYSSNPLLKPLAEMGVPGTGAIEEFIPNVIDGRENRIKKQKELWGEYLIEKEAIEKGDWIDVDDKKDQLESLHKKFESRFSQEWLKMDSLLPGISMDPEENKAREDTWRLYLGLPQQNGTFDISDYKPGSDVSDSYYFKIKDFWNNFLSQDVQLEYDSGDDVTEEMTISEDEYQYLRSPESGIKGKVELIQKVGHNNKLVVQDTDIGEDGGDVMHAYTIGIGQDEKGSYISYYDKWDLSSKLADNPITKGVGEPLEIYDRLYYDENFNSIIP